MHVNDTIKLHPFDVFNDVSSNFEILGGVSLDVFWGNLFYLNLTRKVDACIMSLRESLIRDLFTF